MMSIESLLPVLLSLLTSFMLVVNSFLIQLANYYLFTNGLNTVFIALTHHLIKMPLEAKILDGLGIE